MCGLWTSGRATPGLRQSQASKYQWEGEVPTTRNTQGILLGVIYQIPPHPCRVLLEVKFRGRCGACVALWTYRGDHTQPERLTLDSRRARRGPRPFLPPSGEMPLAWPAGFLPPAMVMLYGPGLISGLSVPTTSLRVLPALAGVLKRAWRSRGSS